MSNKSRVKKNGFRIPVADNINGTQLESALSGQGGPIP